MADQDWIKHAVWWQVYPLGFLGAEKRALAAGSRPVHRLCDIIGWLDYAVELGASGIALGPVFSSETHGYDTVDYFTIDSRLGDDGDFDALVSAARERGLRVLLDGVFNHVGRGFPAFQRVLAEGPDASTASWFQLSWPVPGEAGTDDDGGQRSGWPAEPDYRDFEGHHRLVALNHDVPAVVGHVTEVMKHWLDRGADGWRLDAAYAVPPEFWKAVLPAVRAAHPDAYIVGEVIHGDYAGTVREGGLDSVTQYELWKAIWSSLNDRNFYELSASLERHNDLLETFAPLTFVGNHDVTRIASRLEEPRFLPHALAILFTVGGTPSVYYGDEQGFRGVKEDRVGGDDAVRPRFPRNPGELALSGRDVYRLHQQLIGIRRRHPWLHRASTEVLTLSNEQILYRSAAGRSELTVALNLAADPAEFTAAGFAGPARRTVIAGTADVSTGLVVPPRGWAILE